MISTLFTTSATNHVQWHSEKRTGGSDDVDMDENGGMDQWKSHESCTEREFEMGDRW